MTDTHIASFVKRLHAGMVEPEELAKLTVANIRTINAHLKRNSRSYNEGHTRAAFAPRMTVRPCNTGPARTYSENEILAELEISKRPG